MQTKKLKLSFPHANHKATSAEEAKQDLYRVEQVSNSIQYNPGQYLSRAEVRDIVDVGSYEVTTVPATRS